MEKIGPRSNGCPSLRLEAREDREHRRDDIIIIISVGLGDIRAFYPHEHRR